MNRIQLLAFAGLQLLASTLTAQIQFTDRADLLQPAQHFSGVAVAVMDMNGDGLDDVVRMNQGHQLAIEYQTAPNAPFLHLDLPNVSNESQWGICAADIDNNGFGDVLTGGSYDNIKVVRADSTGAAYSLTSLSQPQTFVQGVNFADVNNDGWLDAFVCHDDGVARIFGNDGTGNLVYQPGWIDLTTFPVSDNSGNYGSVWSDVDNDDDLDLYIAKCRQGVNNPADPRRINQLFLNNGDGTYTQDTANATGLRIGAQSWTADFGDYDNDGDFDCFITNHDVSSQLWQNDGAGHFTDVTAAAGLFNAIQGLPIQGVFRDFDNDGYLDIIVAGSTKYIFHNNRDSTFSSVPGVFDNRPMESFAIGDLNHDGFPDVYGSYAEIYTTPTNTPDALWLNAGNDNHYFGLHLIGVESNRSAVGAKVRLFTPQGTQVREVRSGESYGISNSLQIQFGLGAQPQIDSVLVFWPSGTVDTLLQPAADQYITLYEGGCSLPAIALSASNGATICTGDTTVLSAPDGFQYQWSTGDTLQSLTVTAAGTYSVTVTSADGCTAISNTVGVTVDPVEIPGIVATGDTVFCVGGAVELTATPAAAYLWNTGDTTQTIVVDGELGSYTVSAQGLCDWFTSAPITVQLLEAALPSVTGDTVALDSPATLLAGGDSLLWYDAPVGGTLVFTGTTFVTPPLDSTTTYWVTNTAVFDQPNVSAGMTDHQGSSFNGATFNGQIIFDSYIPFRLASVKVYTNTAGVRKIDLRASDGTVLQTDTFNIPSGITVVDLGFDVPVGTGLILTTDSDVNQANLGTVSPQLRRADDGVEYPYEVPGVLSILESNGGTDRYYYFFDWQVDFYGHECTSTAVPVTATVDSTIVSAPAPLSGNRIRVFPNPSSGLVTVALEGTGAPRLPFRLLNAQGVAVRSGEWAAQGATNVQSMDLSTLPKGVYWLESGGARVKVVLQ